MSASGKQVFHAYQHKLHHWHAQIRKWAQCSIHADEKTYFGSSMAMIQPARSGLLQSGSLSNNQKLKVFTPKKKKKKNWPLKGKTKSHCIYGLELGMFAPCRRGLDNMALSHGHIRKTAVTDRQLSRLSLDIAALHVTQVASSGSPERKTYTFFLKRLKCRPTQNLRCWLCYTK